MVAERPPQFDDDDTVLGPSLTAGSVIVDEADGSGSIAYTAGTLPAGFTFDGGTRELSWDDTVDEGDYDIPIMAENNIGQGITIKRVALDPEDPSGDLTPQGASPVHLAIAIAIPAVGQLPGWHFWNGPGNVEIDGEDHTEAEVVGLVEWRTDFGSPPLVTMDLAGQDTVFRALLYDGIGSRKVTAYLMAETSSGWTEVDRVAGVAGRCPENEQLGFRLTINSEAETPSPKARTTVDHESQDATWPGDMGFANLRPIASGVVIPWG